MAFVDSSPPAPFDTELPPRDHNDAAPLADDVYCAACRKPCRTAAGLASHVRGCDGVGGKTRYERRNLRKREVRSGTVSIKQMRRQVRLDKVLYPEADHGRPVKRGECEGGQRPCPYVSCKWNLFLDVNPDTGSIKYNYPDLEPDQLAHSCALDIADHGGEPLEVVGEYVNMTRERVRQIEVQALARLHALRGLQSLLGDEPSLIVPGPAEPADSFPEDE